MKTSALGSTIKFIGRKAEQELFRRLMSLSINERTKFSVLISGPGGYGKTWLTTKLCQIAEEEYQAPCVLIDWNKFSHIQTVVDVMIIVAQQLSEKFNISFDKFVQLLELDKELSIKVEQLATDYQIFYSRPSSQQDEFKAWLPEQLSRDDQELLSNRTRALSVAFMSDVNSKLVDSPVVVAFDTYELIDYHRLGKKRTNLAEKWVHRFIQDTPRNFNFVITGRDIDFEDFRSSLPEVMIESLPIKVFQPIDTDEYVKAHLGKTNIRLARKIYQFSRGVPLLVQLAIDAVKEFSIDFMEPIFNHSEEVSEDAALVLKAGARRFFQYLAKNEEFLLVSCLIAVAQFSEHHSSLKIIEASFDNAKLTKQSARKIILYISESFSSLFSGIAVLHPEVREVIIDVLLEDRAYLFENRNELNAKFDNLLSEVEAFLVDAISTFSHVPLTENESLELDILFTQLINVYAWTDQQRALDIFLRESLRHYTKSFQSFVNFLFLLSGARLTRIFPKVAQTEFEKLLQDPSRPTLYRFLNALPSRLTDVLTCRTLISIIKLNLQINVLGDSQNNALRLFQQGRVLEEINKLTQQELNYSDQQEQYFEILALAESLISYANILHGLGEHNKENEALKAGLVLLGKLPKYLTEAKFSHCYLTLAKTAVELDDFDSAKEFATKAKMHAPEDQQILEFINKLPLYIQNRSLRLTSQARNLLQITTKVTDESIRKIEDALNLHPNNIDALNAAIRAYRRTGNYEKALEISSRLLNIRPNYVAGMVGRAEVLYEMGQFESAEQVLRIALKVAEEKQDEAPNVFTNLGHCYVMQKKWEEAIFFFNKRIELGLRRAKSLQESNTDNSHTFLIERSTTVLRHVWCRKAFVYLKLKLIEEARKIFLEVTKLDGEYQEAWFGLCIADPPNKQYYIERGIDACRHNIERNEFKPSFYFHFAIFHLIADSALTEKERIEHFNISLSKTREGYGFVHDALFFLELIKQYLDVSNVNTTLVNKVQFLLESYFLPLEASPSNVSNSGASSSLEANWHTPESNPADLKDSVSKVSKSSSKTKRILLLMSDPSDEVSLRLGEEFREIQEKLQRSKWRSRIKLEMMTSVRSQDISQGLLDKRPNIVHFSGHGSKDGAIHFESNMGKSLLVEPDALSDLFAQFATHVECVILNACYSDLQARAISQHIDYVVGMSKEIDDKAAIAFSTGFYQAIGAGKSIEEAFKLGIVQIRLQGIPEHLTPVLIKKK